MKNDQLERWQELCAQAEGGLQDMARILVVSNDNVLLQTRRMLLESNGYEVVASLGYEASVEQCKRGGFDLFILGHSMPQADKQKLVSTFRRECPAPIISLLRPNEAPLADADYHIEPDPVKLLELVDGLLKAA